MNILEKLEKHLRYKIPDYVPESLISPKKKIEVESAWMGLELIIPDILDRFKVGRNRCIEFGVGLGYSTVVFSNFFEKVIGIDTFEGDIHAKYNRNFFKEAKSSLSEFDNIHLVESRYEDWINGDDQSYDFIHVDIVHTFKDTYNCGLWAVNHSKCAIFHDTETFLGVRKAVIQIAEDTGKNLFNYPHHNGLGIIA